MSGSTSTHEFNEIQAVTHLNAKGTGIKDPVPFLFFTGISKRIRALRSCPNQDDEKANHHASVGITEETMG